MSFLTLFVAAVQLTETTLSPFYSYSAKDTQKRTNRRGETARGHFHQELLRPFPTKHFHCDDNDISI